MNSYVIGQRWRSTTEPELGLGIVVDADSRTVEVEFAQAETIRRYAQASAPLQRIVFAVGDSVTRHDGVVAVVLGIDAGPSGLVVYQTDQGPIVEAGLADVVTERGLIDRISRDQMATVEEYAARIRAHEWLAQIDNEPLRGLIGGRIQLLPHQLYIAAKVSSMVRSRVLLSDEPGLGKTIEASLIMHRLKSQGRANRVLVLTPESLTHQWFVELYRKFNFSLRVFDSKNYADYDYTDSENPWMGEQDVICSIDWVTNHADKMMMLVEAHWDLVIVDEAHNYTEGSVAFQLVQALSERCDGLLLLTATPRQLGWESHVGRLQLLDAQRYSDVDAIKRQHELVVANPGPIQTLLQSDAVVDQALINAIGTAYAIDMLAIETLEEIAIKENTTIQDVCIDYVLDYVGTGRAVFRNTRSRIGGFGARTVNFVVTDDTQGWVQWLAQNLASHDHKYLVICRDPERVKDCERLLSELTAIPIATYHENMSLLQRDRAAVWFADEEGARVMICSEIGSEGRNFQFCHNLVLLDLPRDPLVLEQRIGRLDRIGQTETINIHVPTWPDSEQAVLAAWYHEGLDAFASTVAGADAVATIVNDQLVAALASADSAAIRELVVATRNATEDISSRVIAGENALVQANSFREDHGLRLVEEVEDIVDSFALENYVIAALNELGIVEDPIASRSYRLDARHVRTDEFPIPVRDGDPWVITFDRTLAIRNENWFFITIDHGLVHDIISVKLADLHSQVTIAVVANSAIEPCVEVAFVPHIIAPQNLQIARYWPHMLECIYVSLMDATKELSEQSLHLSEATVENHTCSEDELMIMRQHHVPDAVDKAMEIAKIRLATLRAEATIRVESDYDSEIERLITLARSQGQVAVDDIGLLQERKEALLAAIATATIEQDSLRILLPSTED